MAKQAQRAGGVPIGLPVHCGFTQVAVYATTLPRGALGGSVAVRLVVGVATPHRASGAIVEAGDMGGSVGVVGWVDLEFLNPSILQGGSLAYAHT